MPFETEFALTFHFSKHKNEFTNCASEQEYQDAADAFMSAPIRSQSAIRECVRSNEDRVRFDRTTGFFGVQAKSGWLKTFHKPGDRYIFQAYFKWECWRPDIPS